MQPEYNIIIIIGCRWATQDQFPQQRNILKFLQPTFIQNLYTDKNLIDNYKNNIKVVFYNLFLTNWCTENLHKHKYNLICKTNKK